MILPNFISLWAFTVYMENSVRKIPFEILLRSIDRIEICTEVSFTTPEVMWKLIMNLTHTEVKFYSEVKCQTGLSSLRYHVNVLLGKAFITKKKWSRNSLPASFLAFFWRKIFQWLFSINWLNFVAWLPLLCEILNNICIVIIY